jgi:glycosyltransferase involved in cell wall biosynthesis
MQISYDYQIFSLQNVGGISRYFVELGQRLPTLFRDMQTTAIAPLHINEYLAASSINKIGRKINAFSGKHCVLPLLNDLFSTVILKRNQPDILHETYYATRSLAFKGPRILTVFDMIHERFPDQFHGPDRHIARLKAKAVARADHLIAISQSTRDDLVNFLDVAEEKITVIPLASSFARDSHREKMDVNRPKPYLLYVGLRGGVKNFKALVTAYANSSLLRSEFDLLCIGGGEFSQNELEFVKTLSVRQSVKHLNADDRMLADLYSQATLFVYPSLYEGFGIPLLEAMHCGCPVACSYCSSMPEIAGDAAVFFNPEDTEEMTAVLEKTVQSETILAVLKERGQQREQRYTWDACVTKTAKVYRNVL